MAKKASVKSSGKTAGKKTDPAPKKKAARAKKATTSRSSSRADRKADQTQSKTSAADALIGLVESPLVADLLAAAVTAAAATILEHKLKRRQGTGSLVRAVGAAAAAAVGRQLASELDEIRRAADEAMSEKGK